MLIRQATVRTALGSRTLPPPWRPRTHITTTSSSSHHHQPQQPPMCIFSGIQPTGVPHIGNLLGALFNWVTLQNTTFSQSQSHSTAPPSLYFSIVGYHALTMPKDPDTLSRERRDMLAALLAIGLDPERSIIYHQDEVREHAELHWLLSCLVSMGRLRRMTTWKAKIADAKGSQSPSTLSSPTAEGVDESKNEGLDPDIDEEHRDLSLGLFSYPVLQAADVLLFKATHVPIGQDQLQHLELARDIANTFNKRFPSAARPSSDSSSSPSSSSNFFPLPQVLTTSTPKILSLRDPTAKMSKSSPDLASRILLTDDDQSIRAKIKRAVTDSEREITFDPHGRPGVSSLLTIISALRNHQRQQQQQQHIEPSQSKPSTSTEPETTSPQDIADQINSNGGGHALLKRTTSDLLVEVLGPIREKFLQIQASEPSTGYLRQVAELGREKAGKRARETLTEVRDRMGLR